MRDGRFAARQLRRRKRNLARAENIAIVALALLALLLAGKTGMIQQTLPVLGGAQTMEGGYTVGPAISLAGEAPVRLMLRDREDVLDVFIHAGRDYRVRRTMDSLNLSERAAVRLLKRTDKARKAYYKNYTGMDWNNPDSYHMVVNSDRMSHELCVKLICDAYTSG